MKFKKSNSGFTLVELLVAIGLFTIIVTIAVGGFTNALRTQRQVSSLIATQSNVSLALEQMTREIRTAYLFCHDPGEVSVSRAILEQNCGCVITDSGYNPTLTGADPSSPGDTRGEYSNGDYPTWTCTDLDYYTINGTHVHYSVENGQLMRDDGNGPESVTGDNVNVQKLTFVLFGNLEGDNWTPRVTIGIGVSPDSTDVATKNDILNLQTTVSSRDIDCMLGTTAC